MKKIKAFFDKLSTIFSVIVYLLVAIPYVSYLLIKFIIKRDEYIDELKRNV